MAGPRDYHTKLIKSDREKHHITYIQNLKKSQYKWIYLQNRNSFISQTQKINLYLPQWKEGEG